MECCLMRRVVLPAVILSLALVSAAWASPALLTTQKVKSTDIVNVGYKGDKKYYKNKNWKYGNKYHYNNKYKYSDRYWHGGRYWGHRYNYRPYGWQTLGCVAVGPLWYCPLATKSPKPQTHWGARFGRRLFGVLNGMRGGFKRQQKKPRCDGGGTVRGFRPYGGTSGGQGPPPARIHSTLTIRDNPLVLPICPLGYIGPDHRVLDMTASRSATALDAA